MYPVEYNLLSRMLYLERLAESEERRKRLRGDQQPPLALRAEFWAGEHLVHLGNRLIAHYEAFQRHHHRQESARMV